MKQSRANVTTSNTIPHLQDQPYLTVGYLECWTHQNKVGVPATPIFTAGPETSDFAADLRGQPSIVISSLTGLLSKSQ